jgi:hypothetical protein
MGVQCIRMLGFRFFGIEIAIEIVFLFLFDCDPDFDFDDPNRLPPRPAAAERDSAEMYIQYAAQGIPKIDAEIA